MPPEVNLGKFIGQGGDPTRLSRLVFLSWDSFKGTAVNRTFGLELTVESVPLQLSMTSIVTRLTPVPGTFYRARL